MAKNVKKGKKKIHKFTLRGEESTFKIAKENAESKGLSLNQYIIQAVKNENVQCIANPVW